MALPHRGSWFGLPDFGVTEKIGSLVNKPRTPQGGSNLIGSAPKASAPGSVLNSSVSPGFIGPPAPPSGGGGSYNSGGGGGSYAPQTSGQPSGGGGGDSGGGYDYMAALRDAFGQSRRAIEGIIPTYDSDFSNFKSVVEGGINRAKETFDAQNAQDEQLYGQDMRKLLQTDRELRQRRQGTFSALGALDSSAYRDDTVKADQALLEGQQQLDSEKRKAYDSRQREYAAYEQQANSQIAAYSNEIARAKQALQQAVASVNMDEAQSIQNYISQLQNQAQQINAQREAFALNLAQLQAQGTDVMGNLSRMNLGNFSNLFGQNLANSLQNAMSRYTLPSRQLAGAGYIGGGRNDDEKRLLGLA